ncbi:MAG: efflux transporter outer membrane subunit [Polaromonas sp.]|nr:efflux transporter outer membrane subunit [Polaromonas sp.]
MRTTNPLDIPRTPVSALALALCLLLSACAASGPPATLAVIAPPQWYAPLPHNGSLAGLSQWWQQQHDPLLVELIDAAQAVSPTIVTARANIEQARANRATSQAALLPTLDTTGNFSRSVSAPLNRTAAVPVNLGQLVLQTSWELDLFGQNAASRDADQERLEGAQAQWHDARVSVAAEVATQYYSLLSCDKLHLVASADARSRAETARLSALATQAGFEAPATSALARASAAESNARATQQRAQCDVDLKALVALTAFSEPVLRQKLVTALTQNPPIGPPAAFFNISSVPAEVLAQRPDVFNAARELAAASFEVGSARAQRYPRLSLTGVIMANKLRTRNTTQGFNTWSIGPLALTVPLFDGGASEANLEAAKARYEDAASKYRGTCRQAVREVEEALVRLQSTGDRSGDAAQAAEGYQASFAGTEARYKAGLASLVELEDSRRSLLSAQSALVNLELERRSAWIALYRALGGGWTSATPNAPPMVFDIPESALPAWR